MTLGAELVCLAYTKEQYGRVITARLLQGPRVGVKKEGKNRPGCCVDINPQQSESRQKNLITKTAKTRHMLDFTYSFSASPVRNFASPYAPGSGTSCQPCPPT